MPIVFVFDEGGHVAVFPSVDQAQGPIESEDVASGFYRDAFTETGAVVNITAGDRLFATIAVTEEIRRVSPAPGRVSRPAAPFRRPSGLRGRVNPSRRP